MADKPERLNKMFSLLTEKCYVTFRASLKGQLKKCFYTPESCAVKFYVTFIASLKGQNQKNSLGTVNLCRETFRANLKGQINKFLYTFESFAETFCHFYGKPEGNFSLHTR